MFGANAPRVALSSSVLRATNFEHLYSGRSCGKTIAPCGGIPLKQLQSLCDRNPRGITCSYAARDHCFVIASEGVTKKEPGGSFFCYSHSTRTVKLLLFFYLIISTLTQIFVLNSVNWCQKQVSFTDALSQYRKAFYEMSDTDNC